jgi:hypothetical protein
MNYKRYKFEDIQIGDGVYFDDVYSGNYLTQSNFDEYWEVTGKDEQCVTLKLHHNTTEFFWTVYYEQIRQIVRRNR